MKIITWRLVKVTWLVKAKLLHIPPDSGGTTFVISRWAAHDISFVSDSLESGLNVFVCLFAIAINDDWYRVQLSDLLDSADQTSSERYYDGQWDINTMGSCPLGGVASLPMPEVEEAEVRYLVVLDNTTLIFSSQTKQNEMDCSHPNPPQTFVPNPPPVQRTVNGQVIFSPPGSKRIGLISGAPRGRRWWKVRLSSVL